MRIGGLEPRQGDTAYAFLVLRFARSISRSALAELITRLAPISRGADLVLDELAQQGDAFRYIALPWQPPEAGSDVDMQRRLIETLATKDVDEAWFFQTGTELPDPHAAELEEHDDGNDGTSETRIETGTADEGTHPVQLFPRGGPAPSPPGDRAPEPPTWTHGPPPVVTSPRFAVDGYPEIFEEHDEEDFGLAFKLAGPTLAGEETLLLAFHALWLTPYGGRYRNAGVTIDRRHHSAHLWVDRFAVPSSVPEQVGYLLWIASKLDEVVPVVHARFAGATMAQKYADMLDDDSGTFVLGGNPLLAIYARGGEEALDAWLDGQTVWSTEEVAQMLRELAVEVVTAGRGDAPDEVPDAAEDHDEDPGEDHDEAPALASPHLVPVPDATPSVSRDEDDLDDGAHADADAPVTRDITRHAGALLAARARQGVLDARAVPRLRPVLGHQRKIERARTQAIEVLHAARDEASVPALLEVLRASPIGDLMEAVTRRDLVVNIVEALGTFADPAAVASLERVLATTDSFASEVPPAALRALARCLARAPAPRDLSEPAAVAIFDAVARDTDEAEELYFAFGLLARHLTPDRRSELCARLALARGANDSTGLGFVAGLALAAGEAADLAPVRSALGATRALIDSADEDDADEHAEVLRLARLWLGTAEEFPQLVEVTPDTNDLAWLTELSDPDVRERALVLIARLRDDQDAN